MNLNNRLFPKLGFGFFLSKSKSIYLLLGINCNPFKNCAVNKKEEGDYVPGMLLLNMVETGVCSLYLARHANMIQTSFCLEALSM